MDHLETLPTYDPTFAAFMPVLPEIVPIDLGDLLEPQNNHPQIVVTGYRLFDLEAGGGAGGGGPTGGDPGEFTMDDRSTNPNGWEPDLPDDLDPPKVYVKLVDPANFEKVQWAAYLAQAEIFRLTAEIAKVPNDKTFQMADGRNITGAQLKEYWGKLNFGITDETFGSGRGGALLIEGQLATLNADAFIAYNEHRNGLSFAMMHELMHFSNLGQNIDEGMWGRFLVANPDLTTEELYATYHLSDPFEENEEFANFGARELTRGMNVAPLPTFEPRYGFEYGSPG